MRNSASLSEQVKKLISIFEVDFVVHPCNAHMFKLLDVIKDAKVHEGMSEEDAKKIVDAHPVKEWVEPSSHEQVKVALLDQVEATRSTGYTVLAEEEVYAYYRFEHPEKEAQSLFEAWLKRSENGMAPLIDAKSHTKAGKKGTN